MASLKGFLGKLIFPELGVTKAEVITASFRRLTLAGASLTKLAPGDKIQVSLAEGTRTYTPFAFDAARARSISSCTRTATRPVRSGAEPSRKQIA